MEWHDPPATEGEIAAFEEHFGHRMPEDYRRFLMEVNGGRLARSNRRFAYGVVNVLLSLNARDERNDLSTWALFEHSRSLRPSPDLMTVGYDDGGAPILLAIEGAHRGEIWLENTSDPRPEDANPRVPWFDRRDVKKLADSFEQFMGSLKSLSTGA